MGYESQYTKSLENLLENGIKTNSRAGEVLVQQHQYFHLPNVDTNFPILKGKKIFPKKPLIELFWFLNGKIDTKWLSDRNVKYWDNWKNTEGTIGLSYGHQFRNFNGVDQLQNLLDGLLNNPESRRHIINLWNVSDLPKMELEPCVYSYNFSCTKLYGDNKKYVVDLHVTQRSGDSFIGVPYDFCISAWFLNIICDYLNIVTKNEIIYLPHDVHYTIANYHLYTKNIEQAKQYIANVNENKNKVINKNVKYSSSNLSVKYTEFLNANKKAELCLSGFLTFVDIYEYKYFLLDYGPTYPYIKAEISV